MQYTTGQIWQHSAVYFHSFYLLLTFEFSILFSNEYRQNLNCSNLVTACYFQQLH